MGRVTGVPFAAPHRELTGEEADAFGYHISFFGAGGHRGSRCHGAYH